MHTLKPVILLTYVAGVFFGSITPGEAALHHRGPGLIYDDVLDITWLVDANYAKSRLTITKIKNIVANNKLIFKDGHKLTEKDYYLTHKNIASRAGLMNWWGAMAWVEQLEYYDVARGTSYSDWRLPVIKPINSNGIYNAGFSFNGTTDHGYGNKGISSEFRHMFYSNLKNTALCSPTDSTSANDCHRTRRLGLENAGPFTNLQPRTYWSASDFKKEVWAFDFSVGYQGLKTASNKNNKLYAWAVHDGDVGNINREPLTNSAWLFLLLAALFSLPFLFLPLPLSLPNRTQ